MPDSPLQQFFNHAHRMKYISGAAVLLGLVFGLPAYDQLGQIAEQEAEVRDEIRLVSTTVNNIAPMRKRLEELRLVSAEQHETVDSETALELREDVVRLIHNHHCRLLHVQLSEPQSMPWSKEADPFGAGTSVDEDEAKFNLIRTKLSLTAEGNLQKIDELVADIATLHRLAVPTRLVMRENGENGSLKIDIDLTLLDLRRKKAG